jgi:hypothetical protein
LLNITEYHGAKFEGMAEGLLKVVPETFTIVSVPFMA